MSEAGYYRFPTLHQERVVFACEGDLWSVSADGGVARRLTANPGPASHPALSPDGQRLAYTGRDEGDHDIYVMDAEGGEATRLTFLGATTLVAGWSPDGDRVIATSDAGRPFRALARPLAIDPETPGAPTEPLSTGPALAVAFGPSGAVVIARHMTDIARWKRYRGGRTGDLWIDPDGGGTWRRLVELEGNIASPSWLQGRVYFVSDHEGVGNLYSVTPEGEDLQRHTHHHDFYARHPASDGRRIVYHAGADLYLFDPEAESSRLVEVTWRSPRPRRKRRFVAASDSLQGYALHPKGSASVITARGRPFAMSHHEGAVVQLGEQDGVRYRLATWLPDGQRVVAVSDAAGEEALEVHTVDRSTLVRRLEHLDIGRPVELAVSPTQDRLAVANHRLELLLVDVEQATATVVERSEHARIRDLAWSPDGRWLAYAFSNTRQTSQIRLLAVEDGTVHEATQPVLHDFAPAFDTEGRYLYFLAQRDFSPVYDSLHFELGFPHGTRPHLLLLKADADNPFAPDPRWPGSTADGPEDGADEAPANGTLPGDEGAQADPADVDEDGEADGADLDAGERDDAATQAGADEAGEDGADDGASADAGSDGASQPRKSVKPVAIDLEGLADRVLVFPVAEGRYRRMEAVKGRAMFISMPVPSGEAGEETTHGGPSGRLQAWDFKSRKLETLLERIDDVRVTADGEHMIVRSGSRLRVASGGKKPPAKGSRRETGWLDLSRIRVSVDPAAEWRQMLREAWRLQRDQFWTEDMAGVDWAAVYQRYEPLIERVATRDEVSDLLWEMQGELGTSHAYEHGGDRRRTPAWSRGFLGADLRLDPARDGWVVEEVVRGNPWSAREGSPLARPGVDVRAGDVLLAINGRPVGAQLSPDEALVHQAGSEVLLSFAPRGEGQDDASAEGAPQDGEPAKGRGTVRAVTVRTLRNERPLRYRAWVEANRRRVHRETEGRVGYVHVPDMGPSGYAEFHRGFLSELDREALIVDVRFNAGGHVSSLVLEKLARHRLGYDVQRWGAPVPYPSESVRGPLVALTNENAGSDGDMFSHAFKLTGLGPLVGTRTWGGVIGIWPRQMLVDGSVTTQPEFSFWFQDVGWGLENYGTDPDIEIEIAPHDHVAGRDPQMERAIAEALSLLEDDPPSVPRFEPPPSRALPRLPGTGSAGDGEPPDA